MSGTTRSAMASAWTCSPGPRLNWTSRRFMGVLLLREGQILVRMVGGRAARGGTRLTRSGRDGRGRLSHDAQVGLGLLPAAGEEGLGSLVGHGGDDDDVLALAPVGGGSHLVG